MVLCPPPGSDAITVGLGFVVVGTFNMIVCGSVLNIHVDICASMPNIVRYIYVHDRPHNLLQCVFQTDPRDDLRHSHRPSRAVLKAGR